MNKPHVSALPYAVVTAEGVDYDKATPFTDNNDDFRLSIVGKIAVFEMKKHCATEDEARAIVDKYIRGWEILIGLDYGLDELHLDFDHVDIIDLSPPPTNGRIITLQIHNSVHAHSSDQVNLHVSRGKYPSSPKNFFASPDAETMYLRYKAYCQNREKLTSMAYACLTLLEASTGGQGKKARRKAAVQYGIDLPVLDTLGNLCTNKGDATEVRKFQQKGKLTPLSQKEKEWMVAVIKTLIRRVGELAFDTTIIFTKLTMKDFSPI